MDSFREGDALNNERTKTELKDKVSELLEQVYRHLWLPDQIYLGEGNDSTYMQIR